MHKLGGLRPAVIRAERVELERRVREEAGWRKRKEGTKRWLNVSGNNLPSKLQKG